MRLQWRHLAWLTPRPITDHRPLLELMREQRAARATWSDGSTDPTIHPDPWCPECGRRRERERGMTGYGGCGVVVPRTEVERLREALAGASEVLALIYVMCLGAEPMWAEMRWDERCARAANEAQSAHERLDVAIAEDEDAKQ